MSTAQTFLSIIGGLLALAVLVGGLMGIASRSAQKATIERQRAEIGDYLTRLNYVEPRMTALEEQNKMLRQLNDPGERLERIDSAVADNSEKILKVLDRNSDTLADIKDHLRGSAS